MALPRPLSLLGRRLRIVVASGTLLTVLTSSAWAGAVTASTDDPAPASRLPVDHGSPAPGPRTAPSSTPIKNAADQPRRCGEGHASTPRS